jgi:methylmalonyl-CoA mutase, N-terminal domain
MRGHDTGSERRTTYGRVLKSVYGSDDIAGLEETRDLGLPGQYPYTRGARSSGYREKQWTLRQVVGLGTAEETNERLRYLLANGQTGFSVCGLGYAPYESSDPRSLGILGRGGVWIDTLDDVESLFEGIDIGAITINQIGASIPVFAMILAEADRRGVPHANLHGTIQNVVMPGGEGDELRGNHCIDIIEFCARNMPHWNHTSISARNMRDQGLSSVQEVAFGIYQGAFTVRAALARGLAVDSFAPRITFFFSAENELLEEVAKYRAARRLWARLMRERFDARDPRSQLLRFHVQTSALSLTLQQPLNNIIRGTIHALAAVLGGAQSLSVNSFDEVLAIPARAAAMLSLRTQQIIALETDVAEVADPLGGSYCIETLTNEIENQAGATLEKLEGMPAVKAWEQIAAEADEAGYRRQRAIDAGDRAVVGVNRFRIDEDEEETLGLKPREVFEYDPAWRDKQIARLERVKRSRDPRRVDQAKRTLSEAYRARANIVPPMIEAAKAYLSIGEISALLADVAGWEQLRRRHGFYVGQLY